MLNDSIFDIHDVVLIFPIIECLVFVLYRFTVFKNHQLNNILLNIFLLIVAVSSVGVLVIWNHDIKYSLAMSYGVEYFVILSLSLRGPILFLYVQSFISLDFRLKVIDLHHVLPAGIGCLVIFGYSLGLNDLKFMSEDPAVSVQAHQVWYFVKGVSFIYAAAAIVLVWRQRGSSIKNSINFFLSRSTWLTLLVGGFLVNWAWAVVTQLVSDFIGDPFTDIVGTGHNYMFFIQINVLVLCSLYGFGRKIRVEDGQDTKGVNIDIVEPEMVSRILFEIKKQKCYLEPNITIEEVSLRVNLPTRTVSRAIHQHFGKTFLDCINGYRINSAKKILLDSEKDNLTILDVLYMSGFNSTSSFHRYFKRIEGMTPAEYRRVNYIETES